MAAIPSVPGSYILHLFLPQPRQIAIGRLGLFSFPAGDYLYLGSAHGPGGIRARLGRHLARCSKPHWHIDYFRAVSEVRGYLTLVETVSPAHTGSPVQTLPMECLWTQALLHLPGACVPVPGFGAGDCHSACPAHLVAFPQGLCI